MSSSSKRKRGSKEKVAVMEGQTEEERRRLRKSQRQLLDRITTQGDEMVQLESTAYAEERDNNNALFQEVRHTRELGNDGDNLVVIGELATKRSAQLAHSVQQYPASKIVEKLKEEYGRARGGPWLGLGRDVGHLFAAVPELAFMCGPLQQPEKAAPPPKEKKKRQRATQDDSQLEETQYETTDYSQAATMSTQQKKQEEATNRRLQTLVETMSSKEGDFDLMRLLVSPGKFSETVENFFDLSFLVKDGKAKIDVDPATGLPRAALSEPPDEQVPKAQTVVVLNANDNKKLAELWAIQNATLQRE
mmetsp:Transcript_30588/g.98584  ORF Transcript_30588/g.98584 Transcript_30588/m.98584 type:complete len:305 (-) Transcript_30588:365-1279(-)